jgi:hypothetical protein
VVRNYKRGIESIEEFIVKLIEFEIEFIVEGWLEIVGGFTREGDLVREKYIIIIKGKIEWKGLLWIKIRIEIRDKLDRWKMVWRIKKIWRIIYWSKWSNIGYRL